MPAIFRGIGLDPLAPGNIGYLLWMILGYLLVSAVLVVALGRLGDMFGRVRMYNLGFMIFSVASLALSLDPFHGGAGALWLIGWRVVQGVGGAMLTANSAAILTDAFPARTARHGAGHQPDHRAGRAVPRPARGRAARRDRLACGVLGERADRRRRHHLVLPQPARGGLATRGADRLDGQPHLRRRAPASLLASITYGIQPYGGHATGWTSPWVLGGLGGGVLLLVAFCVVETRVAEPMLRLGLFRIRAFAAGNLAALLTAIARGGCSSC